MTIIFSTFKCGEFTLYEGNDGSQNQVCTLYWDQDTTFNFQHYDACENDETRSGILRSAEYGTIITLYDSPSGDKGDDYTEIKVCKRSEFKEYISSKGGMYVKVPANFMIILVVGVGRSEGSTGL